MNNPKNNLFCKEALLGVMGVLCGLTQSYYRDRLLSSCGEIHSNVQNVGFRSSNATYFKSENRKGAVAPQPTDIIL
ncbi:MAG: hypothetical protein V7K90_10355 [Nostoc sp.]|uniref:hypothetical protein n=1 Tax=Nostoc sp. TaxID=1180 RepID=UPI002FFA8CEC